MKTKEKKENIKANKVKEKISNSKSIRNGKEGVSKIKKPLYRVVFDKENGKWNIKKDGADRIIDSKLTKQEVLDRVKKLCENNDTKYIVHKKDGKFQKKI